MSRKTKSRKAKSNSALDLDRLSSRGFQVDDASPGYRAAGFRKEASDTALASARAFEDAHGRVMAAEKKSVRPDGTVQLTFEASVEVNATVRAFYPTGRIFEFPAVDYFSTPPSFKGSPVFSYRNPQSDDGYTLFVGDPRGVYVDTSSGKALYDPVTILEESIKYLDVAAADWLSAWMDTYSGGGMLWPGKIAQSWRSYLPTLTFEQALCHHHEPTLGLHREGKGAAQEFARVVHSVEIGPYHDTHGAEATERRTVRHANTTAMRGATSVEFQPDTDTIITASKPLAPGVAVPEAYSAAVEMQRAAAAFWRSPSGLNLARFARETYLAENMPDAVAERFAARCAAILDVATAHYVAPDTLAQIESGALIFPEDGRLFSQDVPLATSWVAFARPLRREFSHAFTHSDEIWDMLGFVTQRGTFFRPSDPSGEWPEALADTETVRGTMTSFYARVPRFSAPILLGTLRWMDGFSVLDQVDDMARYQPELQREHVLRCAKFLAAFYGFIGQKLVVMREGDLARSARKRLERAGALAPATVRVIHLRQTERPERESSERDPNAPARTEPDHRWWVRPHYMKLRHPRYRFPRDIYVGPSTNGPRGKPLAPPPAYLFAIDR